MARVVVVGTGIAGLITAYRASRRHEVVLVTKAELAESNTKYAQGGIAAALFPDDSAASHIADTLRAGAGLCDPVAVEVLCTEGPIRVRELIELGVEFDRVNGELARGHEAAHSARRVIHAGGDATGLAIEVALLRAVKAIAVEVHEHTFMRDLLVEETPAGRRVAGIEAVDARGVGRDIRADIVVLASGGAGQLYAHTTNPTVTTGDGVAAAWRAGAVLADVEFYQFHPTSLAVPGNPLVSEAVRGDGAVLLDAQGRRFMFDVHPDGELAPRDVVARGIAAQMARQGGAPVLLDATALGAEYLEERFPGISRVTREHGFDWAREPIPVTPAAHYWMGGIRTDIDGRTSLPGLFAVGEATCTGVHGANRLASNSLLESLVFAWRAADAIDTDAVPLPSGRPSSLATIEPEPPVETAVASRAEVQALMWSLVGLERSLPQLEVARDQLSRWRAPEPDSVDPVDAGEVRNLLDLARIIVHAAIAREESRGAHDRVDFPLTRDEFEYSLEWRVPVTEPVVAR
ncbi:L-aspartate oxidase [Microbacteriaceae bacterium SG_E_30_P1]|uniref:L-aspartate oxidase n=1 Tax=Antiquaquibacter oligotrophicus TaxID=2880260 RepID=A0ABT6KPP3_9MICO|nr:L-aspartate oxidase [Antiquaquibacter oligotrophicus]MDH6181127.1 L-aspartate oxidase [Antiquaquibacter oligotrophicus]UDF13176.1 L-aspartate oxidase [Antiquaquibacter oligotrophicus]